MDPHGRVEGSWGIDPAPERLHVLGMPLALLGPIGFIRRFMAFFGPSEGIPRSERTPSGISVRSSSSAWIVPVSRYSLIFSAIDFPTPGILPRPLRSRVPTSP